MKYKIDHPPTVRYDLISIQPLRGHNTLCHSDQTIIIAQCHSSLLLTCFTSSLNQLFTSLRIPHPNYSSPSQRPSFENAGLTCYTLLSPSVTFSLLVQNLTYLFRKSILRLSLFLSVGLISWL